MKFEKLKKIGSPLCFKVTPPTHPYSILMSRINKLTLLRNENLSGLTVLQNRTKSGSNVNLPVVISPYLGVGKILYTCVRSTLYSIDSLMVRFIHKTSLLFKDNRSELLQNTTYFVQQVLFNHINGSLFDDPQD